ncbi:hypothetical protein [Xanthomonas citri]|uniref:Uncharacterized protein n=1 Tax=Xanthomonas citri pv. citri TaxID=611301 RepID=A0A0U5FCW9_XANCI|nr:hypothetical protein [Xanthomonas citri]ARR15277.1 hypothetical protein B7L66_24165 [Xanthomonas citri pv. citri]ARR20018.1 hypothetical protein B7L65_24520 [Xanthomonas citri pv. citri]ARR24699.1 hypothetical protein B7L67_24715 [Xanthomonas citri pv. citri]QRD58328.1 hypothetical protein H8Z75_23300 [Xanthomonas citri pv. citri]CEE63331.1 exported hypothetical protein [Xanthomonas citri pv. citri]
MNRTWIAIALAALLVAQEGHAQVSTQEQADGSRRVRIDVGGALRKALGGRDSQQVAAPGQSALGPQFGAGVISLVPVRTPLGPRYLDSRFDYACAVRLLYSAKTGQAMDAQSRDDCRNHYLLDQAKLKQAGRPYDRAAPAFHTTENVGQQTRYWESLADSTIAALRSAEKFGTEFQSFAYVDPSTGRLNITPMLPTDGASDASITLLPKQLPISLDDPAAEARLKTEAVPDGGRFRQAGQVRCTLSLEHHQSRDNGPWKAERATVRHSEYVRYEVQMTVAATGCRLAS